MKKLVVVLFLSFLWVSVSAALDVPEPIDSTVDCNAIYQCPTHGKQWYEDNPTYTDPEDDSASWRFSTPQEQGMNGAVLDDGLNRIARSRAVFSTIVIRNGAIIKERYFNGSNVHSSNNIHSASKSILGALVGIAIREKHLSGIDQTLNAFFPDHLSTNAKRSIRIRHMLRMESGLDWAEDESEFRIERRPDWIKEILGMSMIDTPGRTFRYSTGNTHVMSGVLQKATGMGLCDFSHRYLFGHLGITAEHWGQDPQGYNSGGYNLYLTARELAKFGLMMIQEGVYNGKQLVPRQWVIDSLTHQRPAEISPVDGKWDDYGYWWWMRDIAGHDVKRAWGYGGQMLYLIPDMNIVVVNTTNTRDFSLDEDYLWFIKDYVIPAFENDPDPDPDPECSSQWDCDDGLFCNGVETCVNGHCVAGTPPFKGPCSDCANGGFSAANLSLRAGKSLYYQIQIPDGISVVRFMTTGRNGDADLYIRRNDKPTDSVFDDYSNDYGSNESITLRHPKAGVYWIQLQAWRSFSRLGLKVVFDDDTCR